MIRTFYQSLCGRLLMVLLTLTALPMLLTGLLAYQHAADTIEQRVVAQLTSVTTLKQQQIQAWLDARTADAQLLANNHLNEEHFTEILDERVPVERRVAFTGFLTDNLRGVQQARNGYIELYMVDATGEVILSTDPRSVGTDRSNVPVVSRTLTSPTGEYVEDVYRGAGTGRPEMAFGHIMRQIDLETRQPMDVVSGAVIIRVSMEESLYPMLADWPVIGTTEQSGRTGETFLVRRDGDDILFLSPLRFDPDAALTRRVRLDSDRAELARRAATGNVGVSIARDYRGQEVLAAYHQIPDMGWGFVAKLDHAEAYAPLMYLTRELILVTAVVLIIAVVAAVLFARALTRPLADLVDATQSITAGKFDVELDIRRRDEIGALASAFQYMQMAVRARDADLRTHAEELSALLALSQRFVRTLDVDRVLDIALSDVRRLVPADIGAILLLDEAGEHLAVQALQGGPEELRSTLSSSVGDDTAAAHAIESRTPVVIPDTESQYRLPSIAQELGGLSILAVPMLAGDQPVGAFWLLSRTATMWDNEASQLVALIANQTAVALERARLFHDIRESYERTLDALAAALDTRDTETEGHSRRVVAYTMRLARELGLSASERRALRYGALLHDIGKIGIPDAILLKPDSLTDDEWAIMRRHPKWGQRILSGIPFLEDAARVVVAHHECWDGSGYPGGLKGNEIPLGARIFAVADTLDAMTSDRPYRDALPFEVAHDEIVANSGKQFDPRVVEAFQRISEDEWHRLREHTLRESEFSGKISTSSAVVFDTSSNELAVSELEVLRDMLQDADTPLGVEEVLQETVQMAVGTLGAAASAILFYDHRQDQLRLVAERGLPRSMKEHFSKLPVDEFHNEEVIREGVIRRHGSPADVPILVDLDVPRLRPEWGEYLCVPIIAQNRVSGVAGLFSRRPDHFDEDDLNLYQAIGEQVGLAVANARSHEWVQRLAVTDALTGARNRRYLEEYLPEEIARCRRYGHDLAVVMLDIDDFKAYNDAHGHPAGDDALRTLGQLLQEHIRTIDALVRFGGDEFLIVMPETTGKGAFNAAERMRHAIETHAFDYGTLTASFGIVHISDAEAVTYDDLINLADRALYDAKQAGRNTTVTKMEVSIRH